MTKKLIKIINHLILTLFLVFIFSVFFVGGHIFELFGYLLIDVSPIVLLYILLIFKRFNLIIEWGLKLISLSIAPLYLLYGLYPDGLHTFGMINVYFALGLNLVIFISNEILSRSKEPK